MTINACVIGDPVAHSLSPKLHTHWLKQYNIDGCYTAERILAEHLADGIVHLRDEGFAGFNVTIPHKENILPFLDEYDALAKSIGAVNTVVIRQGKMLGTNTDIYGFSENLIRHLKQANIPFSAAFSSPIVLGAGGAARAVVKALADMGSGMIHMVARNPEKAERLKEINVRLEIHPWENLPAILPNASMLVNTTPLGMEGKEAAAISLAGLSRDAVVTDIVYNPLKTPLLADAERRGNIVVDGLGMLIFQAMPGFEAWFGKKIECSMQDLAQLKQLLVSS